ncbi:MAG: leucine-rich repeat domain-containing protein, partial [Gammaproteobacteria bacterium]|nr:leucine-rich repeat domain-containing protein [Gammaproteobacteria bacterium]
TVAPTNGVATPAAAGTVDYTPNANFNGTDSFTYQICDSFTPAACATAVVTVTVTGVNDTPVAVADVAGTAEDTPVNINVAANDSDIDGNLDPATISITVAPTNGVATPAAAGTVDYTPNANFNGTDSFTYQICDSFTPAACATAVVSVTVTLVNDAPEFDLPINIVGGSGLPNAASAGGLEVLVGDTLTVIYSIVDPDGVIPPPTAEVQWYRDGSAIPGAILDSYDVIAGDFNLSVIVTPVDADTILRGTSQNSGNIVVANTPPVVTSPAIVSRAENIILASVLAASDADEHPVNFRISGGDDQALFAISGSQLNFINAPDYENPHDTVAPPNQYQVEITANDGADDSVPVLMTVAITNVREPLAGMFADPELQNCVDREAAAAIPPWEFEDQVTALDCSRDRSIPMPITPITDLSGVEQLFNLTSLILSGNSVPDVSPLRNLANLRELDLAINDIGSVASVSGLDSLTGLTHLYLYNNQITDINGLENLTNLIYLDLNINQLGRSAGVKAVPQVKMPGLPLNFSATSGDGQITLSWTEEASTTYRLSWRDSDRSYDSVGSNDTPVSGVPTTNLLNGNTYEFYLTADNGATKTTTSLLAKPSVSSLNGPTNLTVQTGDGEITVAWSNLSIADVRVYDQAGVPIERLSVASPQTFTGLNNGETYFVKVSALAANSLSAIANINSLRQLYLRSNQLHDVSVLNTLDLFELNLSGNNLTELSALSGSANTNLTHLWLHYNFITDLSSLSDKSSMIELGMYNNNISSLVPLANPLGLPYMPGLLRLYAGFNRISDLVPLANYTQLETLWLDSNYIGDSRSIGARPHAPVNNEAVNATAIPGDSQVRVRWDVENGITYNLRWTATGNPSDSGYLQNVLGGDVTVTGLRNRIYYNFIIESVGAGTTETWVYGMPMEVAPGVPQNVSAIANDGSVTLSWSPPQNSATGYSIFYYDHNGDVIGSIADAVSPMTISTLLNVDWHVFRVTAQGGGSDVSPLAGLNSAINLSLSNNFISDLSAIGSGLTHFYAEANFVSDTNFLTNPVLMNSLTELYMGGNMIRDMSSIQGLTNLDYLWMDNNSIQNVSAAGGLSGLLGLSLTGNNGRRLQGLTSLMSFGLMTDPSLHAIWLTRNLSQPCDDLQALIAAYNPGIVRPTTFEAGVDCTNVVVSPALSTVATLADPVLPGTDITVTFTAVDDSGNLVNRGGLTTLEGVVSGANPGTLVFSDQGDGTYTATYTATLAGEDVVEVMLGGIPAGGGPRFVLSGNPLPNLASIVDVPLRGCMEGTIRQNYLRTLEQVEQLTCYGAGVDSLVGIELFTSLKELNLGGVNTVRDFTPLANMPLLTKLSLFGTSGITQLQSLTGFGLLDGIVELDISSINISDYGQLANLASLSRLSVASASLTTTELGDIAAAVPGLTYLNISSNSITDVSNLSGLVSLESLDLTAATGTGITSPSGIVGLSSLTGLIELRLGSNQLTDIVGLSTLTNLQRLYLHSNQIGDVSGLSVLSSLRHLDLSSNSLPASLSSTGLGNLTQLTSLALGGNVNVNDISVFNTGFTGLTDLRLYNIQANTDLTPLGSLVNLNTLDLSSPNGGVFNISPLSNLTLLSWLKLERCVDDISALASLSNLAQLSLSGNAGLSNLSALSGKDLLYLDFTGTDAGNLTFINSNMAALGSMNVGRLREVYGAGSGIDSADWLSGAHRLQYASFWNTSISDVSPLAGKQHLLQLSIGSTSVADVTNLSGLPALYYLDLSGTNIANLAPVSGFGNLRSLSLYQVVNVASIDTLPALPQLWYLDLQGNGLQDVSRLSAMTALVDLNLHGNNVQDASPLAGLTQLRYLSLSSNNITAPDSAFITALTNYPYLRSLQLFNNPNISCADWNVLNTRYGFDPVTPAQGCTEALDELPVPDANLLACINAERLANPAWLLGSDVTNLDCSNSIQGSEIVILDGLEYMANLGQLILDGNAVTDVTPIRNLSNLRSLGLSANGIADITGVNGLAFMFNVYNLWLSSNQIVDVSPLVAMSQLRSLDLSANRIADVSALGNPFGFLSLQTLYLDGNNSQQLTGVADLASLTATVAISLVGNTLMDCSELQVLIAAPNITTDPIVQDPGVNCTDYTAVVASQSSASFGVPNIFVAGNVVSLTVQAANAAGSPLPTTGLNVVGAVSGANNAGFSFADNGNGTYTGEYVAGLSGLDSVTITINGEQIGGVPYSIELLQPIQSVSLGSRSTCGLSNGQVKCWGDNANGNLGQGVNYIANVGFGNNEMGDNLPVVDLNGSFITKLASGREHMCALTSLGQIKCWGTNRYGATGSGEVERRGDEPGEMGRA